MAGGVPGRTHTAVERGRERREAIVEAASELFAEAGYHPTSLGTVAERAGMNRTAVMHHFPSKLALLNAVLDEHGRRFAAVQMSIAQHRGLAALRELRQITIYQRDNRKRTMLWTMLLAESASPESPLRERMHGTYMLFRISVVSILKQAQKAGELRKGVDFEREANSVIAFLNGMDTSWLLDPSVPVVETVDAFLDHTIERLRR